MTMYALNGALGQGNAVSTSGGGTALTTAAASILLPFRTRQVDLIPRNYAGATVAKWRTLPWLTVLKTTDLLAALANMTDYSNAAQDGSTSTDITLNSFDTIANSNALYVGCEEPFVGVTIDVDATHSGSASVLTVKYRKSDNTWADITATDNTASGGKTFAIDGTVTWTEPTDWIARDLNSIVSGISPDFGSVMRIPLFWTRWEVSAALDSTVSFNSMIVLPRTTYAEIPSGMNWSQAVLCGPAPGPSICGISALTDAGTANLIVNAYARGGGYIPS